MTEPLTYEFKSLELTTFDDEMGRGVTTLAADGWEVIGNPQYTKDRGPRGWNEYSVGYHPHFLVLFRRSTVAK